MKREDFFRKKIEKIFQDKTLIVDIGGSLRILKDRGNTYNKSNEWVLEYLDKVDYKILDPVPDYNPDIVGDIHNLPLEDNSQEAIICVSVLEHVENPIKACKELYRVLKSGGYCYVYIPFLYPYHAQKGYYGDYWRFTEDSLDLLFKDFKHKEIDQGRGAIETLYKMTGIRNEIFFHLSKVLDKLLRKQKTKQTSGYSLFLIK